MVEHRRSSDAPIRAMTERDSPDVRAIFEEGIATRQATFETTAPSWTAWDREHLPEPRLVATLGDAVVGQVALSPVSSRWVYRGVAEVSIYVAERARGAGIGGALLAALVGASETAGIWTVQAGILPENRPSLAAHRAAGFRDVGVQERIGQMDDRWCDVLVLERRSRSVG